MVAGSNPARGATFLRQSACTRTAPAEIGSRRPDPTPIEAIPVVERTGPLDREYLQPREQTLWDVITREVPEYLWYGEALLAYQAIPLRPVEPLFRVYHYSWQYYTLKRMGESEAKVIENYLGVIYQSNWEYELDYGAGPKGLGSRAVRRAKRGLRYLQNRWLV